MVEAKDLNYGIVVDSGSSGSRLQIYAWEEPHNLQHHTKDASVLSSVPKLIQQEEWTFKMSPGISSFETKPDKIWDQHFKHIVKYAEKIIPKHKRAETPFFVAATAGMRLVPQNKRFQILNNICSSINSHSKFNIPDCQNYVQVIDGETEGLFGWIGLNYLMGQFNNYDKAAQDHTSYGFMDMGGASTQIAFVPSDKKEIDKHSDDLFTVTLRNINGEYQDWKVFVSTWLGFGANQARKRHLRNAVSSLPDNIDTQEEYDQFLVDPCSPRGAVIDFSANGKNYKIKGLGNYEYCLKDIYPLLLKHLPCKDYPCLFNGVHAPAIDFEKDKFIGISEYWYTANDVFDMGGEYSFAKFNEKVKEFCSDDWSSVVQKYKEGKYGPNMKMDFLKDSCFKASWVINVLHEGFGLPRIGLETDYLDDDKINAINSESTHVPFQSANLIEGAELSWTLGKMLLFVSSQVEPVDHDVRVGITPSDTTAYAGTQKFVPGSPFEDKHSTNKYKSGELYNPYSTVGSENTTFAGGFFTFIVLFAFMSVVGRFAYSKKLFSIKSFNRLWNSQLTQKIKLQLKGFYFSKLASQETCDIRDTNMVLSNVEEGPIDGNGQYPSRIASKTIRTRASLLNLSQAHSSSNPTRPSLGNSVSLSSVGSLLDYQKAQQNGDTTLTNDNISNSPSANNSILDFNKLRSSITNSGNHKSSLANSKSQ